MQLEYGKLLYISKKWVLQKIEKENAKRILIVPAFTTQIWFTRLLRLLTKPPVKLPNSRDSLYFPFRRKEQPQLPNMKLMTCLVSGDSMKTKVFQQRLQIFSSTPAELGLNPNMEHILKNGLGFRNKQQIDPMQPNIIKVLEFLHSLKMRNVGYSVINTPRSASSTFTTIDNHTVGMHPFVCRYLKGVFNEFPVLPKYSFTWDVGVVLKYISSMDTENVQHLSRKLATLLAILCGQRAREILSLMDIRNITMEETCLIIRIGDLLKTSNLKFHNGELKFPKYIENTNICPVTTLKQYLQMISKNRGEIKSLFTQVRPFKPASKDTIARWIRETLSKAGIDTSIFSPHSTRSAARSTAKKVRVPINTILKTVGWRSMKTFGQFYDKEIVKRKNDFALNILDNVKL